MFSPVGSNSVIIHCDDMVNVDDSLEILNLGGDALRGFIDTHESLSNNLNDLLGFLHRHPSLSEKEVNLGSSGDSVSMLNYVGRAIDKLSDILDDETIYSSVVRIDELVARINAGGHFVRKDVDDIIQPCRGFIEGLDLASSDTHRIYFDAIDILYREVEGADQDDERRIFLRPLYQQINE